MTEAERDHPRVQAVVDAVRFPGHEFLLWTDRERLVVRVRYVEADVETGREEEQYGREWYFPAGQTAGQIVGTCFKALLTSLEHRAREHFLYHGKPVLQPHFDVDELWKLMPERTHFQDRILS